MELHVPASPDRGSTASDAPQLPRRSPESTDRTTLASRGRGDPRDRPRGATGAGMHPFGRRCPRPRDPPARREPRSPYRCTDNSRRPPPPGTNDRDGDPRTRPTAPRRASPPRSSDEAPRVPRRSPFRSAPEELGGPRCPSRRRGRSRTTRRSPSRRPKRVPVTDGPAFGSARPAARGEGGLPSARGDCPTAGSLPGSAYPDAPARHRGSARTRLPFAVRRPGLDPTSASSDRSSSIASIPGRARPDPEPSSRTDFFDGI